MSVCLKTQPTTQRERDVIELSLLKRTCSMNSGHQGLGSKGSAQQDHKDRQNSVQCGVGKGVATSSHRKTANTQPASLDGFHCSDVCAFKFF